MALIALTPESPRFVQVLSNMKQMMMDDTNSSVSNSFLLDDDSSIPFSVEDISTAMAETDVSVMINNIPQPDSLKESMAFAFLTDSVSADP